MTIAFAAPPLPAGDPGSLGLSPDRIDAASYVLQREIAAGTMPGAVAMVGRRGRIGYCTVLGAQDPTSGAPMRRDSIFRIFSMTKPVTSLAAMMLIEDGRLLLNTPVSRFIPAFAHMKVAQFTNGRMTLVPLRREMTIHDLMRHTSGLTHEIMRPGPVQDLYAEAQLARRDQTNRDHAERIATLPLVAHPGSEWNYSRSVEVLGHVLELVADAPLSEILHQRIFAPLGMKDTGFFAAAPDAGARLAQPFPADPWTGAPVSLFDMCERPAFQAGGGGLVSTVDDYACFAQMMLDGGTLGGRRIIGRAALRHMTANHLHASITHRPDPLPPGHGFGLGVAVRTDAGLTPYPGSVGQYFWNGSAGTQFWVDPQEELWAILLVQAPGQRDYLRVLFRNLVNSMLEN
ncbi:serine hydrolase domain-containing protein [Paracoccus yeei]|uniref:Beta-lactamase family protein n=1 Tax=Paracoccus yeei TaxID=147645 RepID=A0A5P2QVG5_9RHOB|nr:serine hydrolase domain-containing protein [Paracoccus yeei]QEU09503.1 beta-lactamase family protein [Paracoccus yeei]